MLPEKFNTFPKLNLVQLELAHEGSKAEGVVEGNTLALNVFFLFAICITSFYKKLHAWGLIEKSNRKVDPKG